MKQKRHILHSLTIEVMAVLLASMVAFQICDKFGIRMSLLPFVMVAGYVVLKLLYHVCMLVTGYIIEILSNPKLAFANIQESSDTSESSSSIDDIQKRRMELFHYEYQQEQQHYQLQKKRKKTKSYLPF